MKWTKVTLETTTEAVDLVSAMLDELGIEGIEIEDKIPLSEEDKNRMFIDILPELEDDDGVAEISFYIDTDRDINELTGAVNAGLDELELFTKLGSRRITISETEDKDWINNWKEFFKPFRVDDSIVIKPTWEKLEDGRENDLVIEIDPGTAFGTGSHETTKLCILELKKHLKEDDALLDVGCGSGILSIIGMKLGAEHAVGIDIDDNAARISVENAEVNNIPVEYIETAICDMEDNGDNTGNGIVYDKADGSSVSDADEKRKSICECENEKNRKTLQISKGHIGFMSGNVIDNRNLREFIGLEKYDIVVANILADIIIPLSAVAGEFMKKDALFISSGIINTKKESVCEALRKNHFIIKEINEMGDWVSITAVKGNV